MSRRASRSLILMPLLAALLAVGVGPYVAQDALAAEGDGHDMQLDSARSHGSFQIKVMWLISVTGRFGAIRGGVKTDRLRNQVSVDARIDVATIRMSSARDEAWVKSAEFFDAMKYPQIEFASDAFPQTHLHEGGELPGLLTLHGVSRPVSFQLQPSTCARPAYDCPIEVAGTIRRSAFGMRAHHTTLGDKVKLHFAVYAIAPTPHADSTAVPPPP